MGLERDRLGGSSDPEPIERHRPSGLGAVDRHPDDILDEGRVTRIFAARRDDEREHHAMLRRGDAPATGETRQGPDVRRLVRGPAHIRRAWRVPRTRSLRHPRTSHRRSAPTLRNGRPGRPGRPPGFRAPEPSRPEGRARIPSRENEAIAASACAAADASGPEPRGSRHRRRTRRETGAGQSRWPQPQLRPRRRN